MSSEIMLLKGAKDRKIRKLKKLKIFIAKNSLLTSVSLYGDLMSLMQ
jgi:hypothetical protein